MKKFIKEHILTTTADFYEPVKKLKLSTFKDLVKVFKISVKNRMIPLKYHRDLIVQITIIMQKRNVGLKEVLSFPLGPLSWALASIIGDLKKSNQASLLHRIEGNALPLEHIPAQSTGIFDGMAEVRSFKATGLTFAELADELFRSIISKGSSFSRIDIVFDVYQVISIKSAEMIKRKKNAVITFHSIIPTPKIKQWQPFLSSSKNKTALIKFLGEQWMVNDYSTLLHNKSIYISLQNDCFMYQDGIWQTVDTLTCCHEEADTRMLLHGKYARDHEAAKVVIHTPATDVFILMLCFLGEIGELYIHENWKRQQETCHQHRCREETN